MEGFAIFLIIVAAFLVLAVYFITIAKLVEAAQEKGYYQDGTGVLWFIGILGTPLFLGLITASLPDKAGRVTVSVESAPRTPKTIDEELPEI